MDALKLVIGLCLLLTTFVVLTGVSIATIGPLGTVILYAAGAAVVGCTLGGLALIGPHE
jgi:hypothetical protein